MKLLTIREANDILLEAKRLVKEHQSAKYRLGQAIFNLLPEHLYMHFRTTDVDFFYWVDDNRVIETFFKYYVEK